LQLKKVTVYQRNYAT